jgi:hypothetical protein
MLREQFCAAIAIHLAMRGLIPPQRTAKFEWRDRPGLIRVFEALGRRRESDRLEPDEESEVVSDD